MSKTELEAEVKRLQRKADVLEVIAGRVITSLRSFDTGLADHYDNVIIRAMQETS